MFGTYPVNPDESLCASIAWTLWTEGRLATELLLGALPGLEHYVYWTPPLYYIVLAGWFGLWDFKVLLVEKPGGMSIGQQPAFKEASGFRWYTQR